MHARFVISAASADQFPHTGVPEVALVGRSNVGKSSLINALVKRQIARTSAAPGKTRLANYYLVNLEAMKPRARELYLVDLPGYGYARGGPDSATAFQELAREYFDHSGSRRIVGVLHVIDARHPDLPLDAQAHDWLARLGIPVLVIASKIDKLTRAEQNRVTSGIQSRYGPFVPVSAEKGIGTAELWKVINSWLT